MFRSADQLKFYDAWGSDQTYPHMAVPWTWAFDTPFSWTKQIASHFGGVRQGMAISWPKVIKDKGGIRNQFHHVIDIVPTILEATGIQAPEVVDGIQQKPIEGVSMTYTFDAKNANAPSTHKTQYFEMMGDHAIYHDGWIASTKVMRPPWDVDRAGVSGSGGLSLRAVRSHARTGPSPKTSPPSTRTSSRNWRICSGSRRRNTRSCRSTPPSATRRRAAARASPPAATRSPGRARSPARRTATRRTILNSSYNFRAEVGGPALGRSAAGGDGMIVTQGGRFGGYGFYVLKGKPVFLYNLLDMKRMRWEGAGRLTPGKHTLEFDFNYDGLGVGTLAFNNVSGIGRGGTGVLKVDGKEVARQSMEHTIPLIMQWDENFDVGADTGTPVDDNDYQVPFRFTGKLNKLTLTIDRPKLSAEDEKLLRETQRNNKASE